MNSKRFRVWRVVWPDASSWAGSAMMWLVAAKNTTVSGSDLNHSIFAAYLSINRLDRRSQLFVAEVA